MRRLAFTVPAVLLAGITFTGAAAEPRPGVDWPQFRGIAASGVAEGFSLPTTWDTAKDTNVAWKTPVPGLGLSSPVIWGNEVFISTSISGQKDAGLKVGLYGNVEPVKDDTEHEWRVYALDKKSGKVTWEKSIPATSSTVERLSICPSGNAARRPPRTRVAPPG